MDELVTSLEGQPERRRAIRAALRLSATVREAGRSRVGVRMIDISTHGCRIESTSVLCAGTWIWLSITGLDTQYCRVVWQCEEFAGLEFATPLADAVLETLLGDRQQLSETTIGELREIANRTRRLASKQKETDTKILAELSRTCALEAVIGGLQLGETAQAPIQRPQKPPSR